jgi:hypothetical protein
MLYNGIRVKICVKTLYIRKPERSGYITCNQKHMLPCHGAQLGNQKTKVMDVLQGTRLVPCYQQKTESGIKCVTVSNQGAYNPK